MIPKIIHYVWVGSSSLPSEDQKRVDNWRTLLPHWDFRFWNNSNIDFSSTYLRRAYAVRAWNRVSDYARMHALSTLGGIYLDTDVDLIRPLGPLLDRPAFLGFQVADAQAQDLVNGAVLGSIPGHWLPSSIIEYFNKRLDGRTYTSSFSGPGLLTQMLRARGLLTYSDMPLDIDGVTIYPKRYFYPYSWNETYTPDLLTDDTFAIHRWNATWKEKPPLQRKLTRAVFNRLSRYAPELAFSLSILLSKRT